MPSPTAMGQSPPQVDAVDESRTTPATKGSGQQRRGRSTFRLAAMLARPAGAVSFIRSRPGGKTTAVPVPVASAVQLEIERARRRGQPAEMMTITSRAAAFDAAVLAALVRCTDAVEVRRVRGGWEATLVLDTTNFERGGLQRRVQERLPATRVGWARFPEDGATLQTLIEHAHRSTMEAVR